MKLECYIVKDLLPNYIDDLTSIETSNDIKIHLDTCDDCKSEYLEMKAASLPQEPDRIKNVNEINYMKKYNKKYSMQKKIISLLVVLGLLMSIALVVTCFKAYQLQYNGNAISNYLNITIDSDKGAEYIGTFENHKVYTYQLEDAYFISFTDEQINIKDAFSNKLISINDLVEHLSKVDTTDAVQMYEFENYQIILTDKLCIIAPLSVSYKEIIEAVGTSD